MRMPGLFAFALLFAPIAAPAQSRNQNNPHWHLKQERIDAYRTGDRAYFERILAEDFIGLGPNGQTQNRKDYLNAEFNDGQRASLSTETEVTDFRTIESGGTLILFYAEVVSSKVGDNRFTERLRRLDVYVKQPGGWRLQSMTAVRLPEAPAQVAVPADKLREFAGDYVFGPGLVSSVWLERGRLFEQTTGQQRVELVPIGPDAFYAPPDAEARVSFERGPDGRVMTQVYGSGGQSFRGKRKP